IKANQRAAPTEHESHEPANVAVFLDAVAIVDPDQRQVLHVVKHFEQRNPNEDVRDKIIAVPPKRDTGHQQSKFYRIWPMPRNPCPNKMGGEQNRHKNGCAENYVLAEVYNRRRNERSATQVVSAQRLAQTVRRKPYCSVKPDHAHGEIEPASESIERSRFGVVDATKPVGLHQP